MTYENIKIFALTHDNKPIYYGYSKMKLASKLADIKYRQRTRINVDNLSKILNKYNVDNIKISLFQICSLNNIDEVRSIIQNLNNENTKQIQEPIQHIKPIDEPIQNIQPLKYQQRKPINIMF